MKVSQFENFKNFSSAVAKTINAMMKLSLMRTATGKDDPELPLLQRISSFEWPASDIGN